jgi:streptogramin lyase
VHTVKTGKWPEGITVRGDTAWVADSGDRRLLAVDLAAAGGPKATPVKVGRLPTHMGQTSDGSVYALVNTDKRLYRVAPGTKRAAAMPALPDCPESMTIDADRVFVLLWQQCSSAGGRVARVDPQTGKPRTSPPVGRNPWDLAVLDDRVFVAHEEFISVLSANTLEVIATPAVPGRHMHVRATPAALFVDAAGKVQRLDPKSFAVTHEAALGDLVYALELGWGAVYAALRNGDIVELDPTDLHVRRILAPENGPFEPSAIAFHGEHVLVTTFPQEASGTPGAPDEGRLLVFGVGGR